MRLPSADVAIIDEEKIVDYLLNPKHPDGVSKAIFFQTLGFSTGDWQELAAALRNVARIWPVTKILESVHGRKYIIDGDITSPLGGTAYIRSVWIWTKDLMRRVW